MHIKQKEGIVWVVSGLALIFASLLVENLFLEALSQPLGIGGSVLYSFVKLIDVTGIACFVFGLFHILIETEGWSDYFRERIREIVMQQSYLNTLDKDRLRALQTSILKAQFRDPSIDREGSFLNYLHANLHPFMAKPYREDVTAEVMYSDAGEYWEAFDKVSYVCKRAALGIQPFISWDFDPVEYSNIKALKIEIQFPYTHKDAGKCFTVHDEVPHEKLRISLESYKDFDGLIIIVTATYRVRKDQFQYWVMADPTKNFEITLMFPSDHEIQMKPMVLSPDLILTTKQNGYYRARYDFWMLPESGLAWTIHPMRANKLAPPAVPSSTKDGGSSERSENSSSGSAGA